MKRFFPSLLHSSRKVQVHAGKKFVHLSNELLIDLLLVCGEHLRLLAVGTDLCLQTSLLLLDRPNQLVDSLLEVSILRDVPLRRLLGLMLHMIQSLVHVSLHLVHVLLVQLLHLLDGALPVS